MASFVVQTSYLLHLFGDWLDTVSRYCGDFYKVEHGTRTFIAWEQQYVPPNGKAEIRKGSGEGVIPEGMPYFCLKTGMFDTLEGEAWKRIRWYYYCDNERGNTIRLYDSEHFSQHEDAYLELLGSGKHGSFVDRVLLRGENLGRVGYVLKQQLRRCFAKCDPANKAPLGPYSPTVDVMANCRPTEHALFNNEHIDIFVVKRYAYFQHRYRNNMPNNTLDRFLALASNTGCECCTGRIGCQMLDETEEICDDPDQMA